MNNDIDYTGDTATEQENAAFAAQSAEDSVLWGHNDESTIKAELAGVQEHAANCTERLSKIIDNRDFTATDDMIKALCSGDLGPGGWITSYVVSNKDDFKTPENQVMISGGDAVIKAYAAGKKYFDDLRKLAGECEELNTLFSKFPLEGAYDQITWVENFKKGGYDTSMMSRLNSEIKALDAQFSQKISDIPDKLSSAFYRSYQDKLIDGGEPMPADELKRKYREERIKDYQANVRSRGIESLRERSNGSYDIKADWYGKVGVIDNYTWIITHRKPFESNAEEFYEDCGEFLNLTMVPNDEEITNKAAKDVHKAFRKLTEAAMHLVKRSLDEGEDLREKENEAPYCFMHNPKALEEVHPNYKFNPDKADPFEHGTSYQELYRMALWSFDAQRDEFVKKAGEEHLRD